VNTAVSLGFTSYDFVISCDCRRWCDSSSVDGVHVVGRERSASWRAVRETAASSPCDAGRPGRRRRRACTATARCHPRRRRLPAGDDDAASRGGSRDTTSTCRTVA